MFTNEIISELKYYVYRLIDPRNGETFYVGKGTGNRVFQHAQGKYDNKSDKISEKIFRINKIKVSGFDVAHVIHRHGLDSKTAYEVEAALLDAYPGTTNLSGGHLSGERGVMHAEEVIEKFKAEIADFKHRMVAITINRTAMEHDIYEAVRFCWKMDKTRANKAEFVLAVVNGLIVGVFKPNKWMNATPENFPGTTLVNGRIGFEGVEATEKISNLYMRKILPKEYRKKGAANPVKYIENNIN